ncbi:uncharacterized protein BYT42DRAFT_501032 [Radiomyces spectabilis]|uniref:uncharacterized protein n=1 Tax=Radiomyces spectabilis TaxID=64574 RepID=UPI0022211691|nr:uncharacterized protein BYT42DRAFT_501032 [Radiomyces spectabilis]KAI8373152.1 hypothetical protein BYT42DRAFT_501032 [Radiomyces spectabilis]
MPPTPTFDHRRIQSFGSLFTAGSDQLLDHSHLKPGQNAELLAYNKTLNMYRENAKRTNDVYIQTEFAAFLVEASQGIEDTEEAWSYLVEAQKILKQLSLRGHGDAQYYLANLYALGILHRSHKSQFDKAFPLFVQAAKHHHADAAYRVGKCYEDGLGTRKDKSKAVQYYKKAATLNHPGAMYRLGLAEIHGELGMAENLRDGHKWLKRSAEIANAEYPHALHELAMLHEKGNAVIFIDEAYAHSLYTDAAELGYAPSAYRLGECYEFGHLKLKPDPAMSIYYYTIAADQDHPQACYALAAWYLVGHGTVLEPSEDQAYYWAHRAATKGYKRAEYAVGHFCEVGIGRDKDMEAATSWYQKAADHGDQRAVQRLKELATEGLAVRPAPRRTTNSMLWNRKK